MTTPRVLVLIAGLLSLPAARDVRAPRGSVMPISQALCDDMTRHHVLKPGAPVPCERLRLITFDYVDFNGRLVDNGKVVVMDAVSESVLRVFRTLRTMRFPIAKARLMNDYDGNDDAALADNNTSAFNVRDIVGGSSISLHAYGLAIDVNPVQNPYEKRSGSTLTFDPPAGIDYANRLDARPGKSPRPGLAEAVVDVFANDGFLIWGGYWDDPIDYQHFQVSSNLAQRLAQLAPAQAKATFDRYVQVYRACRDTPGRRTASQRSHCVSVADADGNFPLSTGR